MALQPKELVMLMGEIAKHELSWDTGKCICGEDLQGRVDEFELHVLIAVLLLGKHLGRREPIISEG